MIEEHERTYYEIQLDHKQLILIFFTAVGILVAMFLLGMMVGQGKGFGPLRSVAPTDSEKHAPSSGVTLEEGSPSARVEAVTPRGSEASRAQSGKERRKTDKGRTIPRKKPIAPAPTTASKSKTVPQQQPPGPSIDPSSLTLSVMDGFSVQVMTLKEQGKASQIRQELKEKGYPAFIDVRESSTGSPYYRIRVGKFMHQQDALLIMEKLRQEEGLRDMIVVQ